MAKTKRMWRRHQGMTLVELLIVITIMVVLMSVAIPMVRPAFQGRKLREASRQLNAFFTGAKTRAAQTGRPFGVWIQRSDDTELGSRRSVQLFYADVGPNFTGATTDGRAMLGAVQPPLVPGGSPWSQLSLSVLDAAVLRTMVEPGEYFVIKFDYKGESYSGWRVTGSGPPNDFAVLLPEGILPAGTGTVPGLNFEITRTPTRSNVAPLRMPGDTAIDLSISGVGTGANQFDSGVAPYSTAPVVIMFSPSGTVNALYVGGIAFETYGSIHLLIGRVGKVQNPATTNFADPEISEKANLSDPANLWLTIGHRTGSVITSDNDDTSWVAAAALLSDRIRGARREARRSVRKGGR